MLPPDHSQSFIFPFFIYPVYLFVSIQILQTCTELFNKKPKDGIAALQQAEILDNPLDADQVSQWLRSNPWLDKAMIGEYLSDRRFPNLKIHFVRWVVTLLCQCI